MGSVRICHGLVIATVAMMVAAAPAMADPWKDESGHGHGPHAYHGGEWKEEWHDGRCKYERKWEASGEYKEETKCEGYAYPYHTHSTVVVPSPPAPAVTIIIPFD